MRTLKNVFSTLALAFLVSGCGMSLQMQTASVSDMGLWLNGDTPVIMVAFASELADSAFIENQIGLMRRSALRPDNMNRLRAAVSGSNGRQFKVNVLVRAYKDGVFIGYACNYYYIQGGNAYWGWGANQPDIWFIEGFGKNPRCERTNSF